MNSVSAAVIGCILVVATAMLVMPMALVHPLLVAEPTSKLEVRSDPQQVLGHKMRGHMEQLVKEFFREYEKANSSFDVSGIAALYADTFMFGGPNGVQTVNKDDFLKVVPKRKAYFSSIGLSDTQLVSVEATPMDSKYLLAKVAWKMKLQNSSGSRSLDTFATYILARGSGDALSIVFQIDHQDLASAVKERQSTEQ